MGLSIITLLTLLSAAPVLAGELESFSSSDLCGRDRNFAYQALERMSEELDMIERTTISYQKETENNQAALEFWQKRKNNTLERLILGPDTDKSIDEKIMVAAALKERTEQKMSHFANRALEKRRQLTALEKAINADECPWASKKREERRSAAYIAESMIAAPADGDSSASSASAPAASAGRAESR